MLVGIGTGSTVALPDRGAGAAGARRGPTRRRGSDLVPVAPPVRQARHSGARHAGLRQPGPGHRRRRRGGSRPQSHQGRRRRRRRARRSWRPWPRNSSWWSTSPSSCPRWARASPSRSRCCPSRLAYVERAVRDLGGSPALRMAMAKDGPVVTDNGQFLLDVRFPPATDSAARRPGAAPDPRRARDRAVLRPGQAGPGRGGRSGAAGVADPDPREVTRAEPAGRFVMANRTPSTSSSSAGCSVAKIAAPGS